MQSTGSESSISESSVLDILKKRLQVDYDQIVKFCEQFDIVELGVFGSVLRDDFRPDGENPSDVDLLIEFAPEQKLTWPIWLDLQETSEKLFKRKVDLVQKHLLENPYRRAEILKTNRIIYERS
ncbi:DNA polymerase subunit beta [Leptolyngbyaceae cyanobacterium CCMR0082]|uniref:DNA polymerase subunit beta n=1 Tax=Adonisia turfae CCMR0082 TaxID=2304604 RepID=A0A6M0S450_9CYAN|nr:nucleotidyltransferase domain-containing protein [Adonisia turfae]MDV3351582.1 nucleotidyltransferase domain-containing protein [Leptothoe sp. LEGE 181152]NEZ63146.1 DNA polymerase subunit beta [Adonisia turfae CCMR0082]